MQLYSMYGDLVKFTTVVEGLKIEVEGESGCVKITKVISFEELKTSTQDVLNINIHNMVEAV